jgi:2-keto-myo-inositol isomerase
MCAPDLPVDAFLDLASSLGISAIEVRNDLAISLESTAPADLRAKAERRGIRILSINALQRFNDWNDARGKEARALAAYASASGTQALVLVPTNDGSGLEPGRRGPALRKALAELRPILEEHGILGFVEPLGFSTCSLRLKSEAADAIRSLGAERTFRLVHDTFHHHVAGEAAIFPDLTGLVHVSGVADRDVAVANLRDSHRVLVDGSDTIDNVGQVGALLDAGYAGPFSFEPFAASVHSAPDIAAALRSSMELVSSRTLRHTVRA